MRSFLIRVVPAVAVPVAVLLSVAGCGNNASSTDTPSNSASSPQTSSTSGGEKMTIAFLPKTKGSPYFTSCYNGAQEAADKLGDVELLYDGPTDGSAEQAASMIEKWTLKGVKAIAVSPNDPKVLATAMKAAKDKGIKVLTWDADGDKASRDWFVNQATAEQIGNALVDAMAKDIGAKGDVAIVTATLTAANQNEWIKWMKERLKKYPGIKLVDTKPSDDKQDKALSATQDLIKAYPNLKGVFAISSVAFPGAAEAVKQAGKTGKIMVTGLSTPNDMKAYVKDGTVKSVILWNTVDLGYLAVQAAHAAVKDELKTGDKTFKAGRLGEKKIAGDNILLGDILVFTKDNIDKFDF